MLRKPGNVEVVQVRTSGLGSPSRREFHEGLEFGTLTASHHQSYGAPKKVLIHICALQATTLQILHSSADATHTGDRRTLST